MGIRKRGAKWMVDVSVKGVGRKTATCDTRAEAVVVEQDLKVALQNGVPVVNPQQPVVGAWNLKEAYESCERTIWRDFSYSQRGDWMQAQHLVDFFGESTLLCTITTPELARLQDHLVARGLKPSTVNRRLYLMSTMMRVAVDRGGLQVRPKFPKSLKVRNGRIRFLTRQEEGRHCDWLAGHGYTSHINLLRVLVDTGMRVGEVYSLKRQDISLDQDVVHIWETKADLPRTVPMTTRVQDILSRDETEWRPGRHVFQKWWDRARADLGFAKDPHYVPHVLRHTCASRLVQAGVDILRVKQWLGHKDIQMTQRYAHLAPDSLKSAVKALEVS